jgi:hypothetical protein
MLWKIGLKIMWGNPILLHSWVGAENQLLASHKAKSFIMEVSSGTNNGISQNLYDLLLSKLASPPSDFNLLISEKNEIRRFLFAENYQASEGCMKYINFNGRSNLHPISAQKCFGCLYGYPELGRMKGLIYFYFLRQYKQSHYLRYQCDVRRRPVEVATKSKNDIETDLDDQSTNGISMQDISNPIHIPERKIDDISLVLKPSVRTIGK